MTKLIASVIGALTMVAADVHADPIAIREVGNHVTEASLTVTGTPEQVYALVTDYNRWPAVLSDVTSVKVERGTRENARVQFHSKVFGHDAVSVQFDNEPNRALRFQGIKGPPGGRATGLYLFEPIDGGRRTRVVATLLLDVSGLPKLFIGDAKLREMRQAKLRADLTDVARALEPRELSTAAPADTSSR